MVKMRRMGEGKRDLLLAALELNLGAGLDCRDRHGGIGSTSAFLKSSDGFGSLPSSAKVEVAASNWGKVTTTDRRVSDRRTRDILADFRWFDNVEMSQSRCSMKRTGDPYCSLKELLLMDLFLYRGGPF
jgi:hypothetical protein